MKFWLGLLLYLSFVWPLGAVPLVSHLPTRQQGCEKPLVRKEWRTLPIRDRMSYIKAVHCLMKKPALTSKKDLPGAVNRFEDFLGDHILQTDANHFVGFFYPWHRLLMWAYEKELRACGYSGAQPYWDWSLDANSTEDMFKSEIWDPETGFGGNGIYIPGTFENPQPGMVVTAEGVPAPVSDHTGGGCIPDGPFANMSIHIGPGFSTKYNEYCVRRDFVPSLFVNCANPSNVADGMAQPSFGHFSKLTETLLHAAGHPAVGGLYGTLTDAWASPGDPLFFLHHTNLDRVWWSWQTRNLKARLQDISGPVIPHDYTNELGRNVTLDDKVHVGTTVNVTVPIRDVMDIRNSFLCYTYDKLY